MPEGQVVAAGARAVVRTGPRGLRPQPPERGGLRHEWHRRLGDEGDEVLALPVV